MNKQALTAIEIEAFALSSSTAPDERQQPVSHDAGDYPSNPETRPRAALRWVIDTLALAGGWDGGGLCRRLARTIGRLRQPTGRKPGRTGSCMTALLTERMSGKEQVPAEIGRGLRGVLR